MIITKEQWYKAADQLKEAGIPKASVSGNTSFNESENELYILGGFVIEEPELLFGVPNGGNINIIYETFMIQNLDGHITTIVYVNTLDEESVITATLDSAVYFVIQVYKNRKPRL